MEGHPSTSPPRVRRSRDEQKRETRDALVIAALDAFTRDGYHGASLDGIANEAGFSKGAVYSNFDGKAELFLAVMDYNLAELQGEGWDPLTTPSKSNADVLDAIARGEQQAAELWRGFGLATLEFIATAVRDDTLAQALRERVQVLIDAYERVASAGRPADEDLPVDDVARLMAALDQGVSMLVLSGIVSIDRELMRTGLRRLLDPASAAKEPSPAPDRRASPLPIIERVRQLVDDIDDDRPERRP